VSEVAKPRADRIATPAGQVTLTDPAEGAGVAPFTSSIPYDPERVGGAAVYCSDGRYGDQMDEFLHVGLGLPGYDRVAVPGGGACLAGHLRAMRERGAMERQLRFLIESHQLRRVVLIAHEDCGFYKHLGRVTKGSLEAQQRHDLAETAARIREWGLSCAIEAYFARKADGTVRFEPVWT
jgi:hypothetical protein